MIAIDTRNLCFSYPGGEVISDISFEIQEGEFVGIFGPNGGGKTTLLALLMGFLKPSRGKILIFGKSPSQTRSFMGWVPQTFHYDHHFPISVEEVVLGGRLSNLAWYGKFKEADLKIAYNALECVGMSAYLHVPFASLSGGQAQRVLIARALASEPTLLLLDEPTANVDYEAQSEVYALLTTLKGKMTIVMVTHDLNTAIQHVDKVFCVHRTLKEMPPEKVCEHFAMGLYHSPLKIEKLKK